MPHILGVILRAAMKPSTVRFYESLGLQACEHEHGGPPHFELTPLSSQFVVEIYQRSISFDSDAIMVAVDSIEEALQALSKLSIQPVTPIKGDSNFRFVYVRDPDNRPVMLVESSRS